MPPPPRRQDKGRAKDQPEPEAADVQEAQRPARPTRDARFSERAFASRTTALLDKF